MNRRTMLTVALLVSVIAVFSIAHQRAPRAAEPSTDEAVKKAAAWLALVDGGRYDESWDDAATLFKDAVAKKQWAKQVASVRTPLGRMQERERISATFTRSLPGAPDGEYVVIQFRTRFENKATAIETITPMKDASRGWRVSGYYIK